ncbi:hypothetical protein C8R43DRAFT_1236029 [Mycena crocata]|nr:hypothetical protein C8R43DRAFT_1236029 [Mycena crocata]
MADPYFSPDRVNMVQRIDSALSYIFVFVSHLVDMPHANPRFVLFLDLPPIPLLLDAALHADPRGLRRTSSLPPIPRRPAIPQPALLFHDSPFHIPLDAALRRHPQDGYSKTTTHQFPPADTPSPRHPSSSFAVLTSALLTFLLDAALPRALELTDAVAWWSCLDVGPETVFPPTPRRPRRPRPATARQQVRPPLSTFRLDAAVHRDRGHLTPIPRRPRIATPTPAPRGHRGDDDFLTTVNIDLLSEGREDQEVRPTGDAWPSRTPRYVVDPTQQDAGPGADALRLEKRPAVQLRMESSFCLLIAFVCNTQCSILPTRHHADKAPTPAGSHAYTATDADKAPRQSSDLLPPRSPHSSWRSSFIAHAQVTTCPQGATLTRRPGKTPTCNPLLT